jgi:polyvinyl alcohol dehydrogenase (cytochrome)
VLRWGRVLLLVSVALVFALSGSVASAGPVWVVYHGNAARTGNDTSEPALLPLHQAWKAALDGSVYAQPLVVAGRVFAVSENDTVYALDAHDGHVLWHRHVGTPMTNVVSQVGCGNIDPLGITSTPVIDAIRNVVFVVGAIQDANKVIHHQLFGLDVTTGVVRVSANADPGRVQNPLYIQQRAGLALGNGRVYVGYGGYAGDCGPYHGWMVSLTESGGAKVAFDVTPHDGQGAIWETGGPAIDPSGDLLVGTGNNNPHVATGDYGESVLKFDKTLHLLHNFSNSNATADQDFGTTTPALVGGNMVFEIGKQNVGYLLDAGDLHVLHHLTVCPTSEAIGADAFDGSHLYVPCSAGIQEVKIDSVHRSMSLGWTGPSTANSGPPILAGGALWSVDWGLARLYALNAATGATVSGFPIAIDPTPHFAGPSAALGLVLVGTKSGVSAFDGPTGPPPRAFGAPTAVTATPGNTKATLHWTAPTNPSGSPITSYTITPFIGFAAQTRHTFASTATTEIVTGLTNGKTYTFRIAASTAHGTGPQSNPSNAITPT